MRNPDHHSDVSDHIANAQDFVEQNKALVYDEGNVSETAARLFGIVVPPDVFVGELGEQLVNELDILWKNNPDNVLVIQQGVQNFIGSVVDSGRSLSPSDICASLKNLNTAQSNLSTVAAVEYMLNERYKKRPGSPESQKNEKLLTWSKDMKHIADSVDIQRLKGSNPVLFQTIQSQKKAILSSVPIDMGWAGDSGLTRESFATILLIRKNPSLMQEDIFITDEAKKDYDAYVESMTDEQFAALVDEYVGPDVVAMLQDVDVITDIDPAPMVHKVITTATSITTEDLNKPSSVHKITKEAIPSEVGSHAVENVAGVPAAVQKIMNSGELLFSSDAQEIPQTYDLVAGDMLLKQYDMEDMDEQQQKILLTGVMLSQRYDRNMMQQSIPDHHQKIIAMSQDTIQQHIVDYAQAIAINGTKEAYVGGVTGALSGLATQGLSFDIQDMQYDDANGVFGVSAGDIEIQFGSAITMATYLHKKGDNSNAAPGEVLMRQISGSSGLPTLQHMMRDITMSGLLSGSVSIVDYKKHVDQKVRGFIQTMRGAMQGQSGAVQDHIANERVKYAARDLMQHYKNSQQGSENVLMRDQDHQTLADIFLPTLNTSSTITEKMQLMHQLKYWGEVASDFNHMHYSGLKASSDPRIQGFVSGGGVGDFLEQFLVMENGKKTIDMDVFSVFSDFAKKVSTGVVGSDVLFVEYAQENGVVLKSSITKRLEQSYHDLNQAQTAHIESTYFS